MPHRNVIQKMTLRPDCALLVLSQSVSQDNLILGSALVLKVEQAGRRLSVRRNARTGCLPVRAIRKRASDDAVAEDQCRIRCLFSRTGAEEPASTVSHKQLPRQLLDDAFHFQTQQRHGYGRCWQAALADDFIYAALFIVESVIDFLFVL